ncbi:peroxiredoxin-like family protein [Pseudomonas sp. NPDC090202]|uniref:peroxiredoxin-like family protein n=1 Tax=unclassified Pseudomonas TaxID=196821 RepID=UPI00382ADF35
MSRIFPECSDTSEHAAEIATAAAVAVLPKALRAGDRAPGFKLPDLQGKVISLETALQTGPVVLNFLRGAWCGFGESSLAQLANSYERILDAGATAFAVAPPSQAPAVRLPLPIPELIDAQMKVARAFGLAFELPEALRSRYIALGYTPPKSRKPDSFLAPIQATYLIDQHGVIVLAHVDADYRRPLDNEALLGALRGMRSRTRSREQAVKAKSYWRLK